MCTCGHDWTSHFDRENPNTSLDCCECECKNFQSIPLTPDQERDASAFHAGANYIFNRLGMWWGRDHKFYQSYFEQCAAEGRRPNLISMIAEEVYNLSEDYARGWREDRNQKLEPFVKDEKLDMPDDGSMEPKH